MGGKKTLQPSFPILHQLRTKLGLTESRHATRYPCTYTHTHTHVHAATRAEPILFPILYPSPGIYILPRWPPADVPFNAAKMLEEKFLVALSPNLSPSSEHSRRPVFFQPFRAGIFGRNIYRTGRSSTIIIIIIAVSPGNPHFHEPRV